MAEQSTNNYQTTKLADNNITSATSAVDTYVQKAGELFDQLETEMNGLKTESGKFAGDASDGYGTFFTNTVTPALKDNLTSLTTTVNSMLEEIKEAFLIKVDPDMKNFNMNPTSTDSTDGASE